MSQLGYEARHALLRASLILCVDGWCQHKAQDGARRCMLAAVREALHMKRVLNQKVAAPATYWQVYALAISTLDALCGEVVSFNDAEGMTKEDAIAALRIAADLVRDGARIGHR